MSDLVHRGAECDPGVRRSAVDDVSARIDSGDLVAVAGAERGCAQDRTLLLAWIAGLLPVGAGTIRLGERERRPSSRHRAGREARHSAAGSARGIALSPATCRSRQYRRTSAIAPRVAGVGGARSAELASLRRDRGAHAAVAPPTTSRAVIGARASPSPALNHTTTRPCLLLDEPLEPPHHAQLAQWGCAARSPSCCAAQGTTSLARHPRPGGGADARRHRVAVLRDGSPRGSSAR